MSEKKVYTISATLDQWEEIYKDLESRWNSPMVGRLLNKIREKVLCYKKEQS